MKASILNIGDEILIGQIVNTNAASMAQLLNSIGIGIREMLTVSDDGQHIRQGLDRALSHSDIVLITGGLGPTKDDITKKVLADYFGANLVFDETIWSEICQNLNKRGFPILDSLRIMAMIPDNCTALRNGKGQAPAMWWEHMGKIVVSMPGVPHEMMYFMQEEVLKRLAAQFELPTIVHHTILTAGIAESVLAQKIESVEDNLPPHIKLAYLPAYGTVRLRLTGHGNSKETLEQEVGQYAAQIKQILYPKYAFGEGNETLETVVGNLLKAKNALLGTAESCTGGLIAQKITAHAGSSTYYKGGVVAYSNALKISLLGVNPDTLEQYGAVSEQTALEMAQGTIDRLQCDYALAVTGIAGPGGGSTQKPVGTTCFALASRTRKIAYTINFARTRDINQAMAATVALNMMRRFIIENIGA